MGDLPSLPNIGSELEKQLNAVFRLFSIPTI